LPQRSRRLAEVREQVGPTIFVNAPVCAALQTEPVRFVVKSKGSTHMRVAASHKPLEDTFDDSFHLIQRVHCLPRDGRKNALTIRNSASTP